MTHTTTGRITQIIGPVVDVHFEQDLPPIGTALTTKGIVLEVAQHVGLNRVRTIAMSDTAGLARETKVENTGKPISVPVGEAGLGRLFTVLGETVDGGAPLADSVPRLPIHRKAPAVSAQKTTT